MKESWALADTSTKMLAALGKAINAECISGANLRNKSGAYTAIAQSLVFVSIPSVTHTLQLIKCIHGQEAYDTPTYMRILVGASEKPWTLINGAWI